LQGPLSGASAYYKGTMTGSTSTGGDFSLGPTTTNPRGAQVYLYRHANGSPYIQLNTGGSNGFFVLEFPLAAEPQAGVKQTITHPGAAWSGSYGETGENWGYYCSLPDGQVQDFSVFDTFSGTVKIMPSSDCSKLTLEVQQTDSAWNEKNQAFVECVYQGTYIGTLCDPVADPQNCLL